MRDMSHEVIKTISWIYVCKCLQQKMNKSRESCGTKKIGTH